MQHQSYGNQLTILAWTPVVCTACRRTICDLSDVDLAARLAAHECADPRRFAA